MTEVWENGGRNEWLTVSVTDAMMGFLTPLLMAAHTLFSEEVEVQG